MMLNLENEIKELEKGTELFIGEKAKLMKYIEIFKKIPEIKPIAEMMERELMKLNEWC